MTENCLVKIDVDGPEYEIINSGKNFLSSNKVKSVMIEINSKNEKINTRFLVLCKAMGTKKFIKEIGSQNTRTMIFLTFFSSNLKGLILREIILKFFSKK